MNLNTDNWIVVPMATGTAALWLLGASWIDASGFDVPPRYAQSLSSACFLESSYSAGSAGSSTEAYADWSVKLDEPTSQFAAITMGFIARQKPLPAEISEIVARRLGDMLE